MILDACGRPVERDPIEWDGTNGRFRPPVSRPR